MADRFFIILIMESRVQTPEKSAQELAYLYDLYIVPTWRELFDRLVDEEVKPPKQGRLLDAECGTGSYAIDLSAKLGPKAEVIGVDPSDERLELARAKAQVKKLHHVDFVPSS